jgi:hypothetical protein
MGFFTKLFGLSLFVAVSWTIGLIITSEIAKISPPVAWATFAAMVVATVFGVYALIREQ